MAGVKRVQVVLFSDSGLPEDQIDNTWYWSYVSADPDAGGVFSALQDFYSGLQEYFSCTLTGSGEMRFYDMADPEPRVPVVVPFGFGPVAGTTLPREVALCLSFHASIESGGNPARRKGRVYLGPLAVVTNASATGRPGEGFVSDVTAGALALQAFSTASAEWSWQIYSQADLVARPVIGGWVDDEFDTMRKRQLRPTSRATWGA